MKFGEMKRNTSNWSNFGMLLRRAGLTASAGLSCISCFSTNLPYLNHQTFSLSTCKEISIKIKTAIEGNSAIY